MQRERSQRPVVGGRWCWTILKRRCWVTLCAQTNRIESIWVSKRGELARAWYSPLCGFFHISKEKTPSFVLVSVSCPVLEASLSSWQRRQEQEEWQLQHRPYSALTVFYSASSTQTASNADCVQHNLYFTQPVFYRAYVPHSLYPTQPVFYTACIQQSLYSVQPVFCTACIQHNLDYTQPVFNTACILLRLYSTQPVQGACCNVIRTEDDQRWRQCFIIL